MRKDEGIAVCKLNENGHMIKFSIKDDAIELLPLEDRNNRQEWLKLWWKDRAVPIKQGRIAKAIRSVVRAAATKTDKKVKVEIQ